MNNKRIRGLVAAPFTPMQEDGSVNLELIPDYYRFLKYNKVVGAFICGSTGEGLSLTMQEKKDIARTWADCAKEDTDFKLLLFVGGTCIDDCMELAAYAQQLGLKAVSFTSPFYFRPKNPAVLADCCKEVAVAAPDLPFYYYHIPSLTGVNFPMTDLLKAMDGVIPNLAGIKYTYEDFKDFMSCLHFGEGKYEMLWGRDANLLPAWTAGALGAVGSTYNYIAPIYYDMMRAYNNHELEKAQKLQQKSINMSAALGKYGGSIPIRKSYMKLLGLDCGPVRLPLKRISADAFASMKEEAEQDDFISFSSKNPSTDNNDVEMREREIK